MSTTFTVLFIILCTIVCYMQENTRKVRVQVIPEDGNTCKPQQPFINSQIVATEVSLDPNDHGWSDKIVPLIVNELKQMENANFKKTIHSIYAYFIIKAQDEWDDIEYIHVYQEEQNDAKFTSKVAKMPTAPARSPQRPHINYPSHTYIYAWFKSKKSRKVRAVSSIDSGFNSGRHDRRRLNNNQNNDVNNNQNNQNDNKEQENKDNDNNNENDNENNSQNINQNNNENIDQNEEKKDRKSKIITDKVKAIQAKHQVNSISDVEAGKQLYTALTKFHVHKGIIQQFSAQQAWNQVYFIDLYVCYCPICGHEVKLGTVLELTRLRKHILTHKKSSKGATVWKRFDLIFYKGKSTTSPDFPPLPSDFPALDLEGVTNYLQLALPNDLKGTITPQKFSSVMKTRWDSMNNDYKKTILATHGPQNVHNNNNNDINNNNNNNNNNSVQPIE